MSLGATERAASHTSPMQIAHNPLFTAREKIDLLNRLKAEVTGEDANPDNLAFDASEIDAAIEEHARQSQQGPIGGYYSQN